MKSHDVVFGLALFAYVVFALFPQLDLWVASFFYSGHFVSNVFCDAVFNVVQPVVFLTLLVLLSEIILFITRGRTFCIPIRQTVFFLLCWVVGPGLVVNVALKNYMGRPRPSQIVQFGGAHEFVPAFQYSNACQKNCSFVSGHASVGFVFLGSAFGCRRRFILSVFSGAVIGLVRMAQGGHFLSDIVFSFFFVYASVYLIHLVLLALNRRSFFSSVLSEQQVLK